MKVLTVQKPYVGPHARHSQGKLINFKPSSAAYFLTLSRGMQNLAKHVTRK